MVKSVRDTITGARATAFPRGMQIIICMVCPTWNCSAAYCYCDIHSRPGLEDGEGDKLKTDVASDWVKKHGGSSSEGLPLP